MEFYDVPVNRSVPAEANRGLTSYTSQITNMKCNVNAQLQGWLEQAPNDRLVTARARSLQMSLECWSFSFNALTFIGLWRVR
jgi:hypothetical protein